MSGSGDELRSLGAFYRRHLLEDVLPFWEARTADPEAGGYLTSFDRSGNLTGTDKYTWLQARQIWMFSALYNRVENREAWLDLARRGRDFLVAHAYAGKGRWHYQLDRAGGVVRGPESVFADCFALEALCEYGVAAGSREDLGLVRATYDSVDEQVKDPSRHRFARYSTGTQHRQHSVYMIGLHVAALAAQILGDERTRGLADLCLEQILHVFARDEHRLLFEVVGVDNRPDLDNPQGRMTNPGHALECMWFCVEEGKRRGDSAVVERAIEIVDWMYDFSYDREYGGILAFLNHDGSPPEYKDWLEERDIRWDDKVWWVHAEALYTLALSAIHTRDEEHALRFLDLHRWCQERFYDPEYGEWYLLLHRDGSPKLTHKGGMQKAAYHLPRALMLIMLLLEGEARQVS